MSSVLRVEGTAYLVCATQRSGSTLLCELLKGTEVAGVPDEYFEELRATGIPRQAQEYFEAPHVAHIADALTPREQNVLQLLAQGLQNKEIAAELVITERTVKFYVSSILSKLGAGNRTEAVTLAVQRGLVKL